MWTFFIFPVVAILLSQALPASAQVRSDLKDQQDYGAGPSAKTEKSKDSIRVLILENFPPQFITTPDGHSGLAVDVMREVARRVSLNVEFVTVKSWKEVYDPLKNKTVDVLASMGVSEVRQKLVEFTQPYEVFDIKLFVRKETTDIKSFDDLGGRMLGIQATNVLSKGLIQSGKYNIKTYASFQAAFLGLLSGEIDAVPAPTKPFLLIARAAHLDHRLHSVGPSLREVKRAMAVPKGRTDLRDRLNRGISEFKRTDEYQALLTKWYGSSTPYWTPLRVLSLMGIVLVVSLLIMAAWRYYSVVGLNRRLRENEVQLGHIALNIPGIIYQFMIDAAGIPSFPYISPKVEENLGLKVTEVTKDAEKLLDLAHLDDRQSLDASIQKSYQDLAPFNWEGRLIALSGEIHWIRASSAPKKMVDGSVLWNGLLLDITDHKALEDQLRQAQKMEAVGQLTGGVAHDFNNLLFVMLGNAEMLELAVGEDENAHKNLVAIKTAVNRASSLTQRLLAFSRQQALSPIAANVSDLISDLEEMLRRTLRMTIELSFEPTQDLWPATIDPNQFENALINLAINARDAMPAGGALTIKATNVVLDKAYASRHEEVMPGNYVKVSVHDTGTGMSPEVLNKVFEPFFTTKDVGEGSGLGLSMVYGFVKQSNGHITIESEIGHGATVNLYMPRAPETTALDETSVNSSEIRQGKERILVVEDDENVRLVPVNILKGQGYEVVEAKGGEEAVAHLKKGESFDLLFTDILLPGGMNGVEVAAETRRIQPEIKVLYTTGYADNTVLREGQLNSDATVLTKPYIQTELLDKIRVALDG